MKKSLVALSLLLVAPVAWSLNTKDNPDKVPSIGLEYSGASLKGDEEWTSFTFFTAQPQMKETLNDIVADFRMPVTNNLTLNAGGGWGMNKFEGNDGSAFVVGSSVFIVTTPTSSSMSGPMYHVGARYYFQ